jgi:hypothetical protein
VVGGITRGGVYSNTGSRERRHPLCVNAAENAFLIETSEAEVRRQRSDEATSDERSLLVKRFFIAGEFELLLM